jgi:uncharacterized protein
VRVYLDAAPVIYLAERIQPLAALFAAAVADSNAELVASDLTRLECRVKPIRDGDSILLADFDRFFGSTVSEIVPLTTDVLDRATELSARHAFRALDATHLAAALLGLRAFPYQRPSAQSRGGNHGAGRRGHPSRVLIHSIVRWTKPVRSCLRGRGGGDGN